MRRSQEEIVLEWLNTWKPRLFLQGWAITVEFMEEDSQTEYGVLYASISVNYPYTDAKMIIYPAFWERPRKFQIATFVHELSHCHTEATRKVLERAVDEGILSGAQKRDLWEGLTEQIAKIAINRYSRSQPTVEYHL